MVKVFKFGGASIKDAQSIKNVASIVRQYSSEKLVIIVSAAGKTTNALEDVLKAFWQGDLSLMKTHLDKVKTYHQEIIEGLFDGSKSLSIQDDIHDVFVDLEWTLEEDAPENFDYLYDQVVSVGELLSTKIVAAYFNEIGLTTTWLDARDCVRTDNTYRDANIDWEATITAANEHIIPLLRTGIVLTQGFIGGTTENFTTTLGREGSDFTAAILSYCLNAKDMSIWKDVPGVLTADPRLFDNTTKIDKLSYSEAIEMTYYGAQVIHPKTIRPLQNKKIPLYVKSFIQPTGEGTVIGDFDIQDYPAMIVVKQQQALLEIISKDFFFVDELKFSKLFAALAQFRIKVNMTQNTALAFSVCVNDVTDRIEQLIKYLEHDYTIKKTEKLKLVTIRHASQDVLNRIFTKRKIYLEEKIRTNIQLVIDENEVL